MNYTIEIRNIEPTKVALMRFNGKVQDAPKYMPAVFKSIRGQSSGAPFIGYLSMVDDKGEAEMILCVPTEQTPNGQGVEITELPGARAACLTHIGSYETMNLAYEAMRDYLTEHELALSPPCREVYIKGPGMFLKGNPYQYITELVFPLED